jgi:hypothetical protein
MSNTSNNAVSNGLVGSTVTISSGTSNPGYGAIPPTPLATSAFNTLQQVYTTNTTAGQFLTSGSNGTSWTNTKDNVMVVSQNPPELEVKGRMVINGRDLEERLNTIEKVLNIPERDVILEQSYPLLKRKYDDYINTLSKYRMWESIKGEE